MNVDELYTLERHEKGAEMQVKNEKGKPLNVYLTLAGVDSKAYRKSMTVMYKQFRSVDGTDPSNIDTDAIKANAFSEITIGWSGFVGDDNKELEFSKEGVTALYLNAPYIMKQVDSFIDERENFM